MSESKTIRVRIAVCVSEDGDYAANGWRSEGKDAGREAANMAYECMEGNDGDKQIRWVEADVPAYEVDEPTVEGKSVWVWGAQWVRTTQDQERRDMNTDNTQDGAEPSLASAGSAANDQAEVLAKGIADIIRIAAEPDWIPVTERLPMDGEWVLCYGWKRGCEAAYRSKCWDGWVSADKKNLVTHAYTHWMPLPAPPTDGK